MLNALINRAYSVLDNNNDNNGVFVVSILQDVTKKDIYRIIVTKDSIFFSVGSKSNLKYVTKKEMDKILSNGLSWGTAYYHTNEEFQKTLNT